MAEGKSSKAKPALGLAGAVIAIASVWWFAFRPRRSRGAGEPATHEPPAS